MKHRQDVAEYRGVLEKAFEKHYTQHSDVWSEDQSLLRASEMALRMWSEQEGNRALHLLDIGCGTGRHLPVLHHRLASYTGIDLISNGNWSNQQDKYSFPVSFHNCHFLSWSECTDQVYDLVLDHGTFHHQHPAEQGEYLSAIHQKIADQGLLSVVVWGEPFVDGNIDQNGRYHFYFEPEQLRQLLQAHGFQVERIYEPKALVGKKQLHVLAKKKQSPTILD